MSLINQMLADLERRRNGSRPEPGLLRQVRVVRRAPKEFRLGLILLAAIALLALSLPVTALREWLRPPDGNLPPIAAAPPASSAVVAAPTLSPQPAEPAPVPPPETAIVPPAAVPAKAADEAMTSVERAPAEARVKATPEARPRPPTAVKTRAGSTRQEDEAGNAMTRTIRTPAPREVAAEALLAAREALAQGRPAAAEGKLRLALLQAPDLLPAREELLLLLQRQGRQPEFVHLLQESLQLKPRHLPFVKAEARLLAGRGDWNGAKALLRRLPPPAPAADPEYHALLAAACQQTGEWSAAEAVYRALLQVSPENGTWWVGLGIAAEGGGKRAEAEEAFRRALALGSLDLELAQYARARLAAGGR